MYFADEPGRLILVDERLLPVSQRAQLGPAALGAVPAVRRHLVADGDFRQLRPRRARGPALLQRLVARRLRGVPERIFDARELLAFPAEDVALERGEPVLELSVRGLELLGSVPPLARMRLSLVACHLSGLIKFLPAVEAVSSGGPHFLGRRTRERSMPSSSIASEVGSSTAP